jgi:predicted TIM-barrel fold metal-dependent hydrolase
MSQEHDQWLALTAEAALEPELPICDPHHHLWDRPNNRYLAVELLADTRGAGHNIVQTVFLECGSMYRSEGSEALRPVGETVFVEEIAEQLVREGQGMLNGIVGFANLTLGAAVDETLEAHLAASPNRFRGIRHSTPWDVDTTNRPPRLLMDAAFREGFSRLQNYNLSFDAWLYHPQMVELADLARAFPQTTIILDHIGGLRGTGSYAGKRAEMMAEWKAGIDAAAACPNIVCKVGGIGMTHYGFGWSERPTPPGSVEIAAAMKPYYLYCIEKFGVYRCMFESNFPVDNASYSYGVLWNAYKRLTADFSANERAALFHDTAVRVYRLPKER